MFVNRALLAVAVWPWMVWCQKPVIFPGGVVNAASYSTARNPSLPDSGGLSGGSIASIFGTNLAASTEEARTLPLPTQLGGASVTVNGVAAPLFYVSPNQINFQLPSPWLNLDSLDNSGLIVSTSAGSSEPYRVGGGDALGLFSLDASGCGRAAVLNVDRDGNVSLNSPTNSASPGDWISVYGTGLGITNNPVPDGEPAPSSPLARGSFAPNAAVDFVSAPQPPNQAWLGRAPGLVGVDQFNIQIPATAREGCAVPLQIMTDSASQPITISIRQGGGLCADPPEAGYGEIRWEKTVTTSALQTVTETETVSLSLQASPGRQAPPAKVFEEGFGRGFGVRFGPSCPIPGYRSLGAGTVTIQGPGVGPTEVGLSPLAGPVSGLRAYQGTLPRGTIQPGVFTVAAGGGADVGAFQSSVQIGSGILQVAPPLAGLVVNSQEPFTFTWTGGDPNAWVTISFVSHGVSSDGGFYWQVPASKGVFTLVPLSSGILPLPGGPIDIVLEVEPDPSLTPVFSAPGLSLGGRHLWKYTYRFEGVLVQ